MRLEYDSGLPTIDLEVYFLKFIPIVDDIEVHFLFLETSIEHLPNEVIVWFLVVLDCLHVVYQVDDLQWHLIA